MIDLGATDFYIASAHLPRAAFEEYSTHLFDEWERHVERNLVISDYSLSLGVEEGSIRGRGQIAAGIATLYIAIGTYGSFISGLHTIRQQVVEVGDYLGEAARKNLRSIADSRDVRKRVSSGALGSLQRLLRKFSGEISQLSKQCTKRKQC